MTALSDAKPVAAEELPEYPDVEIKEQSTEQEEKKQTEILIEFINKRIHRIVKSSNDSSKVFALISANNHKETIELGTHKSINWLKSEYYNTTKKVFGDDSYKQALSLIRAKSLFDENIKTENVYKRIAFVNDEIYYDLGSNNWNIVKITSESVKICEHGNDGIMFHRSPSQCEQLRPCLDYVGNPLEELSKLTRIKGELFKVHLVANFVEDIPVPVMAFLGEQGSVKSTVSAIVKYAVDPSGTKLEDQISHFPRSIDDLNIHLANNYLTAFDNVSYVSDEVSDTLCKAITGASYPKRTLYHDTDESILKYQRKIILNGITVNIDQADLAERTIQYFTEKVPENQRLTSKEVMEKFRQLLPGLLGQIFKTLQKAIKLYANVKHELRELSRMADFMIWGEAISRALDNEEKEFVKLYNDAIARGSELLNENSPIIPFLESLLGDDNETIMTTFQFHSKLLQFARENNFETGGRNFPKSSNKIRGYFRRMKPILDHENYLIEMYRNTNDKRFTKNSVLIKIRKVSSPYSPSSPQACLDSTPGEHSERSEGNLEVFS